jgi:hypothetical protein
VEILEIGIQCVEAGLYGPGNVQEDAVGHGQPQGMAESGSGDSKLAVEITHQSALYHCSILNGLGFAVFAQFPLQHLKDADGRHH